MFTFRTYYRRKEVILPIRRTLDKFFATIKIEGYRWQEIKL